MQYTSHKPYEKYTLQRQTPSLKHTINGSAIQFYVSYSRLRLLQPLLLTEAPAIYSVALLLVRVLLAVVVRGLFSALEPAFRKKFLAVHEELLVTLSDASKIESVPGTLSGDKTFPGDKFTAPVDKLSSSSILAPALTLVSCGPKSALFSFPLYLPALLS